MDHEDKQLAYKTEILTADHHEVKVTVNEDNGKVLSIEVTIKERRNQI